MHEGTSWGWVIVGDSRASRRCGGLRPVEERANTPSRTLAAQVPCGDRVLEQRGGVGARTVRRVQLVEYGQGDIGADRLQEAYGSQGQPRDALGQGVQLGRVGAEGPHLFEDVVEVGEEERVHQEAGAVRAAHRDLAESLNESSGTVGCPVRCGVGGDEFDQTHVPYRVEEVQSHDVLEQAGSDGEFMDGQAGCGGGQKRPGAAVPADAGEEFALDRRVLDHRLDDDLRVREYVLLAAGFREALSRW